jgi:hypothetical protein
MKPVRILLSLILLALVTNTWAVTTLFKDYRFEAKVLSDKRGIYNEYNRKDASSSIEVREGDEYSIIIKNPLPIKVAVAVSVDGLNVIDGKRAKPEKSSKWILNPHSSITIRGWQTGKSSLRRFVFTREKYSYARWKEKYDNQNYTRNLGVIGIAYFWDSKELAIALNPPQAFAESKQRAHKPEREYKRAGTGMGRHGYNPVKRVKFFFDTGMYSNRDVLKIYYKFRKPHHPEPFMGDDDGFAPDMYKHYSNPELHPLLVRVKQNVLLANIRNLKVAIAMYYAEHNRFPQELEDLVRQGYLGQIPNPITGDWIYNNCTGLISHSLLLSPRP